jgi:putative mRNA 3-end processing factor
MFHFDRGLKLTAADLAVDFRRRQPRGFISHAHIDHMARHELALCTPETSALYQFRYGPRPTRELPYRQPLDWGGLRLTTYPAGHCLGSAMLLADDGRRSLLYTGDFKLGESATAVRAELPQADVLVIESTYGNPLYRHPPRDRVLDQLFTLVRETLARGATPVIEAYLVGKSQEVTRLLTRAGFPVLQHPKIHAISQVYGACGVDLGDCRAYAGTPLEGHALVVPPRMHRAGRLPGLKKTVSFAVTGWATHERTRARLGVDHAIPLSDHADYDELFEAVERVNPRVVYCTHGPESFVGCLRAAGHNAFPLERRGATLQSAGGPAFQMRLF